MRLDHRARGIAVGLAALLLSACGSTVQVRDARTYGGPAPGSVAGLRPSSAAVLESGSGASPGAGAPVGQVPLVPGSSATSGASRPGAPTTSGTGTVAPRARTAGFGFTATQLFLGVAYDSTYSQELGGAGVSAGSASVGDQKAQVEALVTDVNKRGGVAGRKVVPVFFDTKGMTSQNDPNTLAQSACAYWTQDHQVWAAMTYVVQMDNPVLYRCLAQHHVVFVPLAGESQAMFARYSPYLWSPAGVTPERVAPLWVARLRAQGYFASWDTVMGRASGSAAPVVGLLYGNGVRNNEPELDASFRTSVKQALGRVGLRVAAEAQVTNNQADESSAVLRFRDAGVTHVIGDYSIVNFTQSAESQQYHPRYALSSFSGGVALGLFAPPDQLRGAVGIGWVPSGDVQSDRDPGSSGQTRCRKVMQASGQSTTVRLAWFAMTWACDTFTWLEAVVPATGLDPTALPTAAGRAGLLSGAFTFAMAFPRGRPDGVTVARDYAYDPSCGCFLYRGKELPL